ncbi:MULTISPECIES: BsuBI/PstI family type II restriction endonuclease [unclassified Bradyrhizobium]|uniref:BsuBI/PstI family type II restriction endonuclease n=1 Tax=unclassified Bradyrhizobium TaxID=2631580 RepID=UPI000A001AD0|nr:MULTISPECIES: BsuBI/PstI family type II restriction endonuclease [unclassified Bradyrhizobium]MCK1349180.1 hypothetical protein [Bradyrhizobium sp. CW11]MCK1357160.1 hypothetical protein [Bradyrhizobium sp. CW7]MCK1413196.1 hypothetical protein [Bradyrhizobium sp. CW4]MCK1425788.1 hypothetical protein [Bradyrhizobium sp. 87]MCK1577022.1 hypothetical protein [Bradyrhizobium sp. 174]
MRPALAPTRVATSAAPAAASPLPASNRSAASGIAGFFKSASCAAASSDTPWQSKHLSKGALARITLVRKGASAADDRLLVTFPNGETRRMKPGPSSDITKAVIEEFAPKFLVNPAVLFVTESGNKVIERDDHLATTIGIDIKTDKALPDAVFVDLAPAHP